MSDVTSTVLDGDSHYVSPTADTFADNLPNEQSVDEGNSLRSDISKAFDQVVSDGKKPADAPVKDEPAAKGAPTKEAPVKEDPAKDVAKEKIDPLKAFKDGDKPAKEPVEDKVAADTAGKDDRAEAGDEPDQAQGKDADERLSEGRKYAEAPAQFMAKSKEVWANVPNAVKADFHRVTQEYQGEIERNKASMEEFESVRHFSDMARNSGTNLKDALTAYVNLETLLRQDPIAGVEAVLKNVGMTKEQYINSVLDTNYSSPQQAQQQQSPQSDVSRAIEALASRIDGMQQQQVQAQQMQIEAQKRANDEQLYRDVVEPFAAKNPRYHELIEDVDFFLRSGKVPASLTPYEKLEAAYDLAERVNPRSKPSDAGFDAEPAHNNPRPVDLDGRKSIKSAPSPSSNGQAPRATRGSSSMRDDIVSQARKYGIKL